MRDGLEEFLRLALIHWLTYQGMPTGHCGCPADQPQQGEVPVRNVLHKSGCANRREPRAAKARVPVD